MADRFLTSVILSNSSFSGTDVFISVFAEIPPDSILSLINLTGSVDDISDDPDASTLLLNDESVLFGGVEATLGDTDNVCLEPIIDDDVTLHASFGYPGGVLFGTQKFRVLLAKNGIGTPTARIELWEDGSLIRAGNNINVVETSGQIIEFEWDASEITNENLVEIKVFGIAV